MNDLRHLENVARIGGKSLYEKALEERVAALEAALREARDVLREICEGIAPLRTSAAAERAIGAIDRALDGEGGTK